MIANSFCYKGISKSFTDCINWFEDIHDYEGNTFSQIGPLIRLLVVGDLFYANIIAAPSVDEIARLIALLGKGAVSGLMELHLLPPKESKHSKHSPHAVVAAFRSLYDKLQESIEPTLWDAMGINAIVIEHSLCKLKRMKDLLYS